MEIDFCQNSSTLNAEQKDFANQQYNCFIRALRAIVPGLKRPVNIYLGGSLALKEPSIHCKAGKPLHPHSDLDLYVFTEKSEDISAVALPLVETAAAIPGNLEHSFHFMPIAVAQTRVQSSSIDDLLYGLATPIHESFSRPVIPERQLSSYTMMQLFLSKIGFALVPYQKTSHLIILPGQEKHFREPMDYLKMLTSGLRLQFYGIIQNARTTSDILHFVPQKLYAGILDDLMVHQIVRCREQYDPDEPLPKVDFFKFIHACLTQKLRLPVSADLNTILIQLQTRYFRTDNLVDQLPLLILIFAYAKLHPTDEHLSDLRHAITHIKKPTVELRIVFDKVLLLLQQPSDATTAKVAEQFAEICHESLKARTQDITASIMK